MATKSRAVQFKDLVNGKIFWQVIVYINSDGEKHISPPFRVMIFARPILCRMDYGYEWFVPLSQEDNGKFENIELMPLAEIGVDPIIKVQPDILTHNRLFTTFNYAYRHVARMSLYEPTSQEIWDALIEETADENGIEFPLDSQTTELEVVKKIMEDPAQLMKLANVAGLKLNIDPEISKLLSATTSLNGLPDNPEDFLKSVTAVTTLTPDQENQVAVQRVPVDSVYQDLLDKTGDEWCATMTEEMKIVQANIPGIDETGHDVNGVHWSTIARAGTVDDPSASGGMALSQALKKREEVQKNKDAIEMGQPAQKIPTGFKDLDKHFSGGMKRDEIIAIAAMDNQHRFLDITPESPIAKTPGFLDNMPETDLDRLRKQHQQQLVDPTIVLGVTPMKEVEERSPPVEVEVYGSRGLPRHQLLKRGKDV